MGNQGSKTSIINVCNIVKDPPDLRDKKLDMMKIYKEFDLNKGDITITNNNDSNNKEIIENNIENSKKLIDLRLNIDLLPLSQSVIYEIGMTAVESIISIIYSKLLKKGGSLFIPSRCFLLYNTYWKYNMFNDIDSKLMMLQKICLRDYLKALKAFGICNEKNYPYTIETLESRPNEQCYIEGKYLIFNYSKITNSLDNIRKILNNDEMLLCNLSIYSSFLKPETKKSGFINIPEEIDSFLGMISCCIVGYIDESKKLILRFSLGSNWGDKGYGYISYEYAEQLIGDIWKLDIEIPFIGNFGNIIKGNNKKDYFNSVPDISFNPSLGQLGLDDQGNIRNMPNNHTNISVNKYNRKYKVGGFSVL